MRTYRPDSWSAQARAICDYQIEMIKAGYQTIQGALELFSNMCRSPLIRTRAAKRFGRLLKQGKVKENPEKILYVVIDETDGYEDLIYKGTDKEAALMQMKEFTEWRMEEGQVPDIKIREYVLPD